MSAGWDEQSLLAKAHLYVERALEQDREGPLFAFWCHLAFEPLARAAVARLSPMLLADRRGGVTQQLRGLGVEVQGEQRSAPISDVLAICSQAVPGFQAAFDAASRITDRRSAELHTGLAVFEQLDLEDWQPDLFRVADVLLAHLGHPLEYLFGPEEATAARQMIDRQDEALREKVQSLIRSAADAFAALTDDEREARLRAAQSITRTRSRYTRPTRCPACDGPAWRRGEVVSTSDPRYDASTGEMTHSVVLLPDALRCPACGLQLDGHPQVRAAGLGGQFVMDVQVDPVELLGIDVAAEAEAAGLVVVDPSDYAYQDE